MSPDGPSPSRWTLRALRVSLTWLRDESLSGVWRVRRGYNLRLRSARVQHDRPDPDYAAKAARLVECWRAAAAAPDEIVVVFLDEMGSTRWPEPAPDWAAAVPLAQRTGENNRPWRIVGALPALTGRVDDRADDLVGRRQLIAFSQ